MNIKKHTLNPTGSELFIDSESFLQDLADTDSMNLQGGYGPGIEKLLEFGINVYALNNIVSIAKTFSAAVGGGGLGNGGAAGGGGGTGNGGGAGGGTTE
ncbi:hypothetical protein [Nostoc sp. FACHB-280]|uniref:hypothetical protein n=1 Tax=Nostoc sp. FACHB-280 TaxID=2692839 RepID=UPI0018EF6C2E|nr:hypothetical protein [Nostoc sp. FACHB-280]